MLIRILNRLFDHRVIVNCDRDPYLLRWYLIRKPGFAIFLHKFIRSDEDRALHDHPWDFIVIPIVRGYIEHSTKNTFDCPGCPPTPVPVSRRVWPIIGTRFRHGTYRHRVQLHRVPFAPAGETNTELPSWSIFIRFKEFRDWGFHAPEGWIQWNKWWQEKCE